MNNVSFKAKLIVNDNLYKNLPQGTPEGYVDNLTREYQKFLDHRVTKAVTEGDTIELYRYREKGIKGFSLGMRFTSDKLEKPIESPICTNEKIPNIRAGSLLRETMLFIIIKSKIPRRYFESFDKTFIRAAQSLLDEKKTEK